MGKWGSERWSWLFGLKVTVIPTIDCQPTGGRNVDTVLCWCIALPLPMEIQASRASGPNLSANKEIKYLQCLVSGFVFLASKAPGGSKFMGGGVGRKGRDRATELAFLLWSFPSWPHWGLWGMNCRAGQWWAWMAGEGKCTWDWSFPHLHLHFLFCFFVRLCLLLITAWGVWGGTSRGLWYDFCDD